MLAVIRNYFWAELYVVTRSQLDLVYYYKPNDWLKRSRSCIS